MKASAAARSTGVALLAAAAVPLAGAGTAAGATQSDQLAGELGTLWTTVLQTPSPHNAFGAGGVKYACWDLGGGVVAPFGPSPVPSCTVGTGTRVFEIGRSVECSTFEGTSEADLAPCARRSDAGAAPHVTVDGQPVDLTRVQTAVLQITLPVNNVFGLPAGTTGESVGDGWVALLDPLAVGTHTIQGPGFTTTIVVR